MKKIMALILSFTMLLTLCACGKVSGEKAIGNYFDLTANPDKKLVEDSFPAQVLEYIEAKYDMDADDLLANWEKTAEHLKLELEFRYGANCKTSYKVLNISAPDNDDYDDIMEDLLELGFKNEEIEDIAEAEVKITYKGDEAENTDTETFELFKVGGNWYTLNAVEIIPVFY